MLSGKLCPYARVTRALILIISKIFYYARRRASARVHEKMWQSAQNGPKWPKMVKMAQNGKNSKKLQKCPKVPKMLKSAQNAEKWALGIFCEPKAILWVKSHLMSEKSFDEPKAILWAKSHWWAKKAVMSEKTTCAARNCTDRKQYDVRQNVTQLAKFANTRWDTDDASNINKCKHQFVQWSLGACQYGQASKACLGHVRDEELMLYWCCIDVRLMYFVAGKICTFQTVGV